MYRADLFDGTKAYSWFDTPVDPGPWKIRVVMITAQGKTNEGALVDMVVVT